MAVVRRRVDPARCVEVIRESGVRLPHVDYERFFAAARADLPGIPLFFLVNLTRLHRFAGRAGRAAPP
jgi:hypothetical protein